MGEQLEPTLQCVELESIIRRECAQGAAILERGAELRESVDGECMLALGKFVVRVEFIHFEIEHVVRDLVRRCC